MTRISLKKTGAIMLVALCILLLGINQKAFAKESQETGSIKRIYGQDRYATNSMIIRETIEKADKVLLINGEAKRELAEAIKMSFEEKLPIILSQNKTVNPVTDKLLKDLKVKEVILLGNEKDISKEVFDTLAKTYKVSRINPKGKEVGVDQLIKLIPKADEGRTPVIVPKKSLHDLISAVTMQSLGNYRLIPKEALNPEEINHYKNLIIVGGPGQVDFTTRAKFDPNKEYTWYQAAWALYHNQALDNIYNTLPVEKAGDLYKVTYADQPFKLKSKADNIETALGKRIMVNLQGITDMSDKTKVKNLSTYDKNTRIYTPKFEVLFTEAEYQLNQKVNTWIRGWVAGNIDSRLDDMAKVRIMYDWFINNTHYSKEEDGVNNPHMFSTLVFQKRGVCSAYADGIARISIASNVDAYVEVGYFTGAPDKYHAWNVININGDIRNVDATIPSYSKDRQDVFFNKSREEFKKLNYVRY